MLQRLKDRVTRLENNAKLKQYETGAWLVIEKSETRYSLHTSRLGRFEFSTREELNSFIKKHHRGVPPSWSFDGIMVVSYARTAGDYPEES